MMQDPTYEQLQKNLQKLEDEAKLLDLSEEKFLSSLEFTPDELKAALKSSEFWEAYLKLRKKMVQEIETEIKAIPHQKKAEEARKKLNLPNFALFCK